MAKNKKSVSAHKAAKMYAQEIIDAHISDEDGYDNYSNKGLRKALISLWELGYSEGFAARFDIEKELKVKP
jgi:hypothetical protein